MAEPIQATRVEPVQERSRKRLESLRAAAREAIEQKGIERFTTADVARISGASIGTVYRYYSDRVAVLDDLFPQRQYVLRPGDEVIEETPADDGSIHDAAVLRGFLQGAYDILNDQSLRNPRDRVRNARAKIAEVLGITES